MNAPTAAWTIGQLATRVAEALAADVPGQANGRVREVPDVRTLRWYTSIGLLDRPAAMRGRTALYGRRHLLQVVAVKRLQGEGWSLAEIQERLIGANEVVLESIAAVSGDGFDAGSGAESDGGSDVMSDAEVPQDAGMRSEQPGSAARRSRFWAVPSGAADDAGRGAGHVTVSRSASGPAADRSVVEAELSALEVQSSRSVPTGNAEPTELAKLAGPTAQARPELAGPSAQARPAPAPRGGPQPRPQPRPQPPVASLPPRLEPRRNARPPILAPAIRLAPDVTLVLDTDHAPEPADLTDIAEAARPLLDLLRRLGLAES